MATEKRGSINIERRDPPQPRPELDPWTGVGRTEEDDMATDTRPKIEMEALTEFLGPDGGRLSKEAPYTLRSEEEALQHVQNGLGKRLSPPAKTDTDATAETTVASDDAPWTLQLSPEEYLNKFPDGSHAAQAKAEIARREKKGEATGGTRTTSATKKTES